MSRFNLSCPPPIANLPRRVLWFEFPRPAPLLRALRAGESPDTKSRWSAWLAQWGWTWAVKVDACLPADPFSRLWLKPHALPAGFDARVLALATALRLKPGGIALDASGPASNTHAAQRALEKLWPALQAMEEDDLADVLSLALLQGHNEVFDFDVCPTWQVDANRVIAERRSLQDERAPAPCWLKSGYALLGPSFDDLRQLGDGFASCQTLWQEFADAHHPPAAFALAYWWEAIYCLTERHLYDDAQQAQQELDRRAAHLEQRCGLLDPLWHHQRGRLHYYAGNHGEALQEYLRELNRQGDNPLRKAMLEREVANVLSDLSCVEAAAHHATLSIDHARREGQKSELFKSLGRLAEIRIKQANPAAALSLLEESQKRQERMQDQRSPAQTLCYLGHAQLLNGHHDEASLYYDLAAEQDHSGTTLPYLVMGRFALAARRQDEATLQQLWNAHHGRISDWLSHDTHAMPAAACVLAASAALAAARERMAATARALVERNYIIEALPFLEHLSTVERNDLMPLIQQRLQQWQKALRQLPASDPALPLNGPAVWLEVLQKSTGKLPAERLPLCYPMNLVQFAG